MTMTLTGSGTGTVGVPNIGTAQTLSGTSATISGIPAGTKRIMFSFANLKSSGGSSFWVRIGPAGGVVSSGYESAGAFNYSGSAVSTLSQTTGFYIYMNQAGIYCDGVMTLTLVNPATNLWASAFTMACTSNQSGWGGGSIALSGALTQIQIVSGNGTDTLTGTINVIYD